MFLWSTGNKSALVSLLLSSTAQQHVAELVKKCEQRLWFETSRARQFASRVAAVATTAAAQLKLHIRLAASSSSTRWPIKQAALLLSTLIFALIIFVLLSSFIAYDQQQSSVTTSIRLDSYNNNEIPKKSIVFIKNQKAGSSALRNMLLRYAFRHNLTIGFPSSPGSQYGYVNYPKKFKASLINASPSSGCGTASGGERQFNLLPFQARFDAKEYAKIMPPHETTVYVSSVREPVSHFRSMWSFFQFGQLCNFCTMEEFLVAPVQFMEKFFSEKNNDALFLTEFTRRSAGTRPLPQNPQLYQFGLDYADIQHWSRVEQKVEEILEQIDLLLISERMDESLVLLAQVLNVELDDVVIALKSNTQRKSKQKRNNEIDAKILAWNAGDVLLYERALEKFGNLMRFVPLNDSLAELKILREKYRRRCVSATTTTTTSLPRDCWQPLLRSAVSDVNCALLYRTVSVKEAYEIYRAVCSAGVGASKNDWIQDDYAKACYV